jgi:hypothetical protein
MYMTVVHEKKKYFHTEIMIMLPFFKLFFLNRKLLTICKVIQ